MNAQLETILANDVTRQALKMAIKDLIREMIAEAATGKVELPEGFEPTEDVVQAYRCRLGELDALLNPPLRVDHCSGLFPNPPA